MKAQWVKEGSKKEFRFLEFGNEELDSSNEGDVAGRDNVKILCIAHRILCNFVQMYKITYNLYSV